MRRRKLLVGLFLGTAIGVVAAIAFRRPDLGTWHPDEGRVFVTWSAEQVAGDEVPWESKPATAPTDVALLRVRRGWRRLSLHEAVVAPAGRTVKVQLAVWAPIPYGGWIDAMEARRMGSKIVLLLPVRWRNDEPQPMVVPQPRLVTDVVRLTGLRPGHYRIFVGPTHVGELRVVA